MSRTQLFAFPVLCLLLFTACRKDVLHWQSVEQIHIEGKVQLNTALFLPGGIGIIGGGSRFDTARVLRSSDQGATWQWRPMAPDTKGFSGSCIAPDGIIYFCGLGLNICSSSDALSSYHYDRLPGPYEFMGAVSFGTAAHGVGVTALGTDSGAVVLFDANRTLTSFTRFNNALYDVKMFSAVTGIAVGSGIAMKTKDGGQSWTRLPVTGDNFNSISAIDSNLIYISGLSGYIMQTKDGGNSWKRLRNGGNITLPHYQLWDLLFLDELQGYAVGEKGVVIYTDDGGNHWSEFDRFTTNNLRFITLCPDGKLLTGGENGSLYRLQQK